MSATATSFYQTGGTLRPDAPSYVERQADRDLYEGLSRGEFCYVLHSRQMGKSSLMARVAARLREQGVTVLSLDLSAIGQNLTPEQWYDGLLRLIAWQLDLDEELEAYWQASERLGPLQRWMGALRQVVLPRCPGRVVISIDEIDAVRSLPFSTDEFFAGIRECYNRRTEDPEFASLTFCLLGVASPADLIRDTRTTPFNIGRRIELTDFTAAEAAPLAAGLGRKELLRVALLQRVLHWTSGHPYLTQRLCEAVAADNSVTDPAGVERLCEALFLSPQARERDDNLLFVRDRLLRSEGDRAALLDLYGQVLRGKRVAVDETNPLVSHLGLAGVIRAVDGRLRLRNRIYEGVFDREWIRQHMPDAELRRQRAAYRRGLLRATTMAAAVLAAVGGLAVFALGQARRADRVARQEAQQRRRGERLLYAAHMNLAAQAWESGNVSRAVELLEAHRPQPGQEDLRGFEWRYLWGLCQGDQRFILREPTGSVASVAFSPDGRMLASATENHLDLWDVATRRKTASLQGHKDTIGTVAFSQDGRLLASAGTDKSVKLWNVATKQCVATLRRHTADVNCVAFSPDGNFLASGSDDETVVLWDVRSRRAAVSFQAHQGLICVAFSPSGQTLAAGGPSVSGGGDPHARITMWDVAAKQAVATLRSTAMVSCMAFSRDGRTLAAGSSDYIQLWAVATRRKGATLWGHHGPCISLAFSPNGKILASGNNDSTVRLWDTATKQEVGTLRGHRGFVSAVVFSPNGKTLVSAGSDGTIRLWDPERQRQASIRKGRPEWVGSLAISPEGRLLASAGTDNTIKLWDAGTEQVVGILKGHTGVIHDVTFSPDGKVVASTSADKTVMLWDVASRQHRTTLRGHTGAVWGVAFSPNGKLLATGDDGFTVRLWDVAGRRELGVLNGTGLELHNGLAFSPDGKLLATVMADASVRLWDVASQRPLVSLAGQGWYVTGARFSPDGRILAAGLGGAVGTVRLWDIATHEQIADFRGHSGFIDSVAFSPDGQRLASSGDDGTVRLWDLATKQEMATLHGHAGAVFDVAFSPDGNALATSNGDTSVRLWRAAPFAETDPLQVPLTIGGDRTVQLQWQPLPHAIAYNVYRGRLAKLNTRPLTDASFTDQSPGLVNGRAQSYTVAAIGWGTNGNAVEVQRVVFKATPVAAPPGFLGCSINESPLSGSVSFDANTSVITLRGAGRDLFDEADGCYFLSQAVAGDFQVTVRELTRPTTIDQWSQAGLMIRETLEPYSRNASLIVPAAHGLQDKWRPKAGGSTMVGDNDIVPLPQIRLPMILRLTRRGDTITAEYSRDNGQSFQTASDPIRFARVLAKTLYAGLVITSHDPAKITEAKFRDLEIHRQ
jgi:WD40 repeat protein